MTVTDSALPNVSIEGSKKYTDAVLKVFRTLQGHAISKAVLAEIGKVKAKAIVVRKYPSKKQFSFSGANPEQVDKSAPAGHTVRYTDGAAAEEDNVEMDPEWGPIMLSTKFTKRTMYSSGEGSDVTLYYWPWLYTSTGKAIYPRINWYAVDEILLHELVHALRQMTALRRCTAMGDGYENSEEFVSILVTNVYHAARGRVGLRGSHANSKPLSAKLSDSSEYYKKYQAEIDQFLADMPTLAAVVAASSAKYNPLNPKAIAAAKAPAAKPAKLPALTARP